MNCEIFNQRILHSFAFVHACVKVPPSKKKPIQRIIDKTVGLHPKCSKTLAHVAQFGQVTCLKELCHLSLLKEEEYYKSNWENWPPIALLGARGDLAREETSHWQICREE